MIKSFITSANSFVLITKKNYLYNNKKVYFVRIFDKEKKLLYQDHIANNDTYRNTAFKAYWQWLYSDSLELMPIATM